MIFITKGIKLEENVKQIKQSAKRTGVVVGGCGGGGGGRQAPRPTPLPFLLILSCVQLVL